MFSSKCRAAALLSTVALSGCNNESATAGPSSPLDGVTVTPTLDGGAVLEFRTWRGVAEKFQAVAEWRKNNPGDFRMVLSSMERPLYSSIVLMIPRNVETAKGGMNTISLSEESMPTPR